MAKIIAPPAIHNLDGFLDLLLNPDKYTEYLKQLQAMKNDIISLLGVLSTVEKADEHLANAQQRIQESEEILRQARLEANTVSKTCAAELASVKAAERQLEERVVRVNHELAEKESLLASKHTQLAADEQAVIKREQMADAREAELQRRAQTLDEELAKLKKKKDLLAEIS